MPKLTILLAKWAMSQAIHIWITSRFNFKEMMKSQSSKAVLKDKYTKVKRGENEPKAILYNIFSFTVDVDMFLHNAMLPKAS